MSNNVRTAILLGVLTALVVAIALLFGLDLWMGLVIAAVANFSAYWFSDKLALRGARAKPVSEREMPEVYAMVRELTENQGMPMPSIHRIKSKQANAFATGRNPRHAAVAVTDGIMDLIDDRELRGVLGHEISHVKNRDILISSMAATLAAALSFFVTRAMWSNKDNSWWVLPAIVFTPIASAILQAGISKSREYEADRDGGDVTEDPLALASALEKIENSARIHPLRINAAIGSLFVSDPLLGFGKVGWMFNLMSTHPPTDARIERLEAQAKDLGVVEEPSRDEQRQQQSPRVLRPDRDRSRNAD